MTPMPKIRTADHGVGRRPKAGRRSRKGLGRAKRGRALLENLGALSRFYGNRDAGPALETDRLATHDGKRIPIHARLQLRTRAGALNAAPNMTCRCLIPFYFAGEHNRYERTVGKRFTAP